MYIDFSELSPEEPPVLRLKTLSGTELGIIPWAFDIEFSINCAALSTISFKTPKYSSGVLNPLYDEITGYKAVYTESLGIYVITSPETAWDSEREYKAVHGYSLEKLFSKKRLYLEEGTYNFWDPTAPDDTILGRIIETSPSWQAGYVSSCLVGKYRTFDEYKSDVLSFCYQDAAEKFSCAFIFDVYNRKINVYSESEESGASPVYLSGENLLTEVKTEELTDEITTKLYVYGASDLSIRDVNPAGTAYLINLDWFIYKGELDVVPEGSEASLGERFKEWQEEISARQGEYTALCCVRSSLLTESAAKEAELTELQSELTVLQTEQSVIIQALALETTEEGIQTQEEELAAVSTDIAEKEEEIAEKEEEISQLEAEYQEIYTEISGIVSELAPSGWFTEAELEILNDFLFEETLTDETFAASSVSSEASGESVSLSGDIMLTDSELEKTSLSSGDIWSVTGGSLSAGDLEGDVIRAVLSLKSDGSFVLTAYMGTASFGDEEYDSASVTVSGECSGIDEDTEETDSDGLTVYKGTELTLHSASSRLFITGDLTDFSECAVRLELYDYGEEYLASAAWPCWEFSVKAANFLMAEEFESFKNGLLQGGTVYLSLGDSQVIKPRLTGISLNFEDPEDFSLTFSNRYTLRNGAEALASSISSSAGAAGEFSASKYIYNQTVSAASAVSDFISGSLSAAKNTILAAENQSVVINGAGIQVGGDSDYQIRIVDNMIAMTSDGWQTAKLAIGLFATEDTGTYWGVNADVIGGKLLLGSNLVIENTTDDGTTAFRVDSTGAWLYNTQLLLSRDNGGKLLIHPDYGIAAGNESLYDTSGTTVYPSFIDDDGGIITDSEGMPENTNFYLDLNDGSAWFRGTLSAPVLNGSLTASDSGGWLTGCGINVNDGVFYVSEDGDVTMSGDINLSGSIIWGADANPVTEENVFSVLTSGGTKFGIFSDSSSSALYINAGYVKTGTLNADEIELSCCYGGFCRGMGSDGENTTYGAMMYGSNGAGEEPYFIVTGSGCRMTAGDGSELYVVPSGIYMSSEPAVTSDGRLKEDISGDLGAYEEFFRRLRPVKFRLKNGSSRRLHTGFIAQQVERALYDSGLTPSDFAGFVREEREDGELCRLRYQEFSALNTYMIQRLTERVEKLERITGINSGAE